MVNGKSNSTARARAMRTNARRSGVNSTVNNRDTRFMVLVALLAVALISTIGIAVAALSQDLKVEGTATVKQLNWDIHFDALKPGIVVSQNNTAKEITTPTIDTDKTTISSYDVEVRNPGDSVAYEFNVVNDGDVDAKITAIAMAGQGSATLTCTSNGGTSQEQVARNTETCKRLNYTLTYKDGTTVAVNDVLTAGATKTMVLKLEYTTASDGTSYYPDDDVAVSDLGVTISYGQN